MGRGARELVLSLAAVASGRALDLNSASRRGGPEGIHVYNLTETELDWINGGVKITLEDPGHFWPSARGPHTDSGALEHEPPPANLGAHLSWTWTPPSDKFQSVIAGGPVIDADKHIFVAATDGIRRFSPAGEVLWHHKSYGGLSSAPSLHGSMVFTSHTNGNIMGLDSKTGRVMWSRRWTKRNPKEGGYPAGYQDKWIFGAEKGKDTRRPGGAQLAWALDATTGWLNWEFRGDNAFVNFSPIFPPGENTMVLMDFTGTVYKVDSYTGDMHWKNRPPNSHRSYSEGGAVLGPDGKIYTCSNPGISYGKEGERGVLRSFNLATGEMDWEQTLPQPCNTIPSVAKLGGNKGHSVVVTPGSTLHHPDLHGSIMAFDALTGDLHWRYQAPRLSKPTGAAKFFWAGLANKTEYDGTCYPAHWSAPRISNDGSVWAARADGKIYNVRGPPADFKAAPEVALARAEERAKFETDVDFATTAGVKVSQTAVDAASSTGAMAFAPKMTVMASCNTLHVYHH